MNKLLPDIEELKPIVDSRLTFSGTPFIREFYKLNEIEKIQILVDIVKQTMIYNPLPNPDLEKKCLIGDDYTASLVFIDYVKSLKLFKDIQLVLVSNKKNIDIDNYYDCHFSILVKDINNREYIVDATPNIGYGIGEVNDLSNRDLYNKYIVVDEQLKTIIDMIRRDMYDIENHIYSSKQIDNYKNIRKVLSRDIFNGLLLKYYNCIMNSEYNSFKEIIRIDFHDKINYINDISSKNDLNKISVTKCLYDSLRNITKTNSDYEQQQKLAQLICSEAKIKKTININGVEVELNHITPRLLWEYGYNVVILKSSSYLAGISASCEDYVIPKRDKIINSYMSNLGEKNTYNLRPMAYFHPHGLKYEFQMNGPNKIILVNDKQDVLNKRKHYLRENMTKKIQNHFVRWFNGEKIMWDTNLNTNLVHVTDDATEASIHLLAGYPEYQAFTRFNYPNPVLRKEKRK